ncbi:MAG: hypothetical protein J6Y97_05190, partial [Prevotella sp.]|nr:hypothetical protein [Prevotella sp.]
MSKYLFLLIILIAGLCFCSSLKAEHVLQSRHLTTADGLAANTVRHIFQDEEGYIWFGTNNGLSRYDGYNFRNYQKEAGIEDLRIKEVREDEEHHILISTIQGGFYCLDKKTGHTIIPPQNLTSTDTFIETRRKTLTDYQTSDIKDDQGNLWRVGDNGDLRLVMVKENREFTLPHVINDRISYGSNFIFRICYTSKGIIAIATNGNGLFFFDPRTNRLEHFVYEEQTLSSPLASNNVISIMEDRTGSLWIGYEQMGVTQLHLFDETGFRFIYPSGGKHTLGTDAEVVRAVHFDEQADLLVIADKQHGVSWYDSTLNKQRSIRVDDNAYCITQDPEGGYWLGTRGSGIWHEGRY